MFRQKIAEVTDCSCRLMLSQSQSQHMFKTPNTLSSKITYKEPKEKYSLKTQTVSSQKQQGKVTPIRKLISNPIKTSQELKISISGNLDAKKQKLQKSLVCSPEQSQVRKINQAKAYGSNIISKDFSKFNNVVKTAQNCNRQKQKVLLSSHNQAYFQYPQNISSIQNNFRNHKNNQILKIPKKSLKFQDYYQYVNNPYSVCQNNKENIQLDDNSTVSNYKIDLKIKKQMRKFANQTMPLQFIKNLPQVHVFHQSLEKNQIIFVSQNIPKDNPSILTKKIRNLNFNQNLVQKQNMNKLNKNLAETQRNNFLRVSRKELKTQVNSDVKESECQHPEFLASVSTNHNTFSVQESIKTEFSDNKILNMSNLKPQKTESSQQISPTFQMIGKKSSYERIKIIQRVNCLTDIITYSADCESVNESCDQTNQQEQSVVIMRYQDFLDEMNKKEEFYTSDFLQNTCKILESKKDQSEQIMNKSINIATKVKPCSRNNLGLIIDSSISNDLYLKKTIKIGSQY